MIKGLYAIVGLFLLCFGFSLFLGEKLPKQNS